MLFLSAVNIPILKGIVGFFHDRTQVSFDTCGKIYDVFSINMIFIKFSFFRLLSAYNNRILDTSTDQHKSRYIFSHGPLKRTYSCLFVWRVIVLG